MLTLALCRIFKQDGYLVAPFKAQNMTANTRTTPDGHEIAVSQWLQAMAAGVEPTPDMNPIILTPGKNGTRVVLGGKEYDTINAYNFKEIKARLVPEISKAYARLCASYDIIVIEGAGSPVELNLNKNDIVNMGMAKTANAPVLLVADIDRGGVFASLYGTIMLLDEGDKERVKATIVNRFRGEPDYFADGVKILEDITDKPVAGVIPFLQINLPEEDGLFADTFTDTNYEAEFDKIANHVRKAINMDLIYKILESEV